MISNLSLCDLYAHASYIMPLGSIFKIVGQHYSYYLGYQALYDVLLDEFGENNHFDNHRLSLQLILKNFPNFEEGIDLDSKVEQFNKDKNRSSQ